MDDLLALLSKGDVDAFNDQRPRRGTLDLFAADLAGVKAHGVDLSSANLEKADLTGADFTDAILARANLSGADISECTLSGVMALQSRWREAWMEDVDFTDADLSAGDLSDATLHRVDLTRAVLTSARFKRTELRDSNLTQVELSEGRLAEVDAEGCDFTQAILVEARFNQAKLMRATLKQADLTRARLGGADLTGANLQGATLVEADLSGATLTGANLAGADLSRADLSDIDLDGVDLSEAILTDAQLPPSHMALAVGSAPPLTIKLIEEATLAASGKRVAVLWENPEPPPARSWLRVMVGKLDKDAPEDAAALPLPAELAVARTIAGTPDGFTTLVLLERPGGTAALIVPVDGKGQIGTPRRVDLGYTPAARPVFRYEDDRLVLYGIAREGPGVVAHTLDEAGLTTLHGQAMRTVRGFVSDHHPVVLSKGGTLVLMTPRAVGRPISAPADFPGRRYGAAPTAEGMALVWSPNGKLGLKVAQVGTRTDDDERHILKKQPIGFVDAATIGETAWAIFTKEPAEPGGAATAWALRLPDGEPYAITTEETHDVSEIKLITGGDKPLAAISDLDGSLSVYELKATKAERRWVVS